jgi:transposase
MNNCVTTKRIASPEATCGQFNARPGTSKLGIDVHQHQYVVVRQQEGRPPQPPQRFSKSAFLLWAAQLRQRGGEVHAVYEACGFGFTLQRQLTALGIHCYVVAPQRLDERQQRVKTDGRDAKAIEPPPVPLPSQDRIDQMAAVAPRKEGTRTDRSKSRGEPNPRVN